MTCRPSSRSKLSGIYPVCTTVGSAIATPGGADKQVQFNDGGVLAGAAQLYWDKTNNRLGIGTATPKANLEIRNTTAYDGADGNFAADSLTLHGSVNYANGQYFGGITWANSSRRRAGIASVMEHADSDFVGLAFFTQGADGPGPMAESMRISRYGNVGIGTTSPGAKLDVAGGVRVTGGVRIGSDGNCTAAKAGTLAWNSDALQLCLSSGNWAALSSSTSGGLASGAVGFVQLSDGAGGFTHDSTALGQFFWDSTNHGLGIGTVSPSTKLEVNGAATATDWQVPNTADTSEDIGGAPVMRKWKRNLISGELQPLGKWVDTEGTVQVLITVSSETSGDSGTSLYLFQGGFSQISTSWSNLVPLSAGRGHGESTGGYAILVRRDPGNSYAYEIAVGVASGVSKTFQVSALELKGGMNFSDTSATAPSAYSSAGDVFSVPEFFAQQIGIDTGTPQAKLDVAGGVRVGSDGTCTAAKAGMLAWNSNSLVICLNSGTFATLASDLTGGGGGSTGGNGVPGLPTDSTEISTPENYQGIFDSSDTLISSVPVWTTNPSDYEYLDVGDYILFNIPVPQRWSIHNNRKVQVSVAGHWYPNDTRGTFNAVVEFWNSNTSAWVGSGTTITGFGTTTHICSIPYNNPPHVTKVRIRITSDGAPDTVRIAMARLFSGAMYGELISLVQGGTAWFDKLCIAGVCTTNPASVGASGAAGAVQFSGGSGAFASDESNLFWDNTNKRLGISTTSPAAKLDVAGEIRVGNTGLACSAATEGTQRYNSTTKVMEFCNGSGWQTYFSESTDPNAFSFTDQSGVALGSTITSDAVALAGFPGSLTATCTNCTAIARNGVWGGTIVGGFTAGDTIAIRVTSSADMGTPVVATATVGGTVSAPWTVTTATMTPDPFSFTDVSDATTNITYTSNAVALSGFSGTLTATCTDCTSIGRNGVWGVSPLSGFAAGDTIAIRQTSSNGAGVTVTASVTLGSTTSGDWSVTTAGACATGILIGEACPDGSIFAGFTPDGDVPFYTTRCDAGQSWDGGACTGTRSGITWNNGTANWLDTGFTSHVTGLANTAGLVALIDAASPYKAAKYCGDLSAHGHSDWYLPARNELAVFYAHHAEIGGFDTSGSWYWSASEYNNSNAWVLRFSDSPQTNHIKPHSYYVRCARR